MDHSLIDGSCMMQAELLITSFLRDCLPRGKAAEHGCTRMLSRRLKLKNGYLNNRVQACKMMACNACKHVSAHCTNTWTVHVLTLGTANGIWHWGTQVLNPILLSTLDVVWSKTEIDSDVAVQPSNSMGSDECTGSKKRSSFLGRPLKELEDLW